MSATPNPFRDVGPWCQISFGGGAPVKAALVAVDDIATIDEWKKIKSKEASGQTRNFAGTTKSDPKLTFYACDADDFDDLGDLWNLLAPNPGATPAKTTTNAGASFTPGGALGSPSAAEGEEALDEINATSASASSDQDVGPRPPTVSVKNAILEWHGITAIARGKWEGPTPTPTRGWIVVLTVVPQDPQRTAGAGAMGPAVPGGAGGGLTSAFAGGNGGDLSSALAANAAAQAAGT